MIKEEVFSKLSEIFIDIFDNEEIKIEPGFTADDIDEWNSLTHIQLVVEIETVFKIKFTALEITSFKNIEDMTSCILSKA